MENRRHQKKLRLLILRSRPNGYNSLMNKFVAFLMMVATILTAAIPDSQFEAGNKLVTQVQSM